MKNIPRRLIIYSKDVENITGRHERTANRILERIKKYYNKKRSDFVTVSEFCSFMGLKEEVVRQYMTG